MKHDIKSHQVLFFSSLSVCCSIFQMYLCKVKENWSNLYLVLTDPHSSMLDQEDEETNEHMVMRWLEFTFELFAGNMVWIFTAVLTFLLFWQNSTDGWSSNDALNSTDDDHGKGNVIQLLEMCNYMQSICYCLAILMWCYCWCQMTVGKLMETYESCIASLRKSQSNRRKISLKKVAEANFTKAVSSEGDWNAFTMELFLFIFHFCYWCWKFDYTYLNVLLPRVRTEKHLHMKTINIKIQFYNMFIKCCHVWFQIKLLYQLNSVLANILFVSQISP
jgi:hypothetical protein